MMLSSPLCGVQWLSPRLIPQRMISPSSSRRSSLWKAASIPTSWRTTAATYGKAAAGALAPSDRRWAWVEGCERESLHTERINCGSVWSSVEEAPSRTSTTVRMSLSYRVVADTLEARRCWSSQSQTKKTWGTLTFNSCVYRSRSTASHIRHY